MKKEILEHYMDTSFQVTIDRDPTPGSTGNGLMHTGFFTVILANQNSLLEEDKDRFAAAVDMCTQTDKDNIPIPGLYVRSIWKKADDQSHDDYIGISAGAYFAAPKIADAIIDYGERYNWCFDVQNPRVENPLYWHDRFFGLVAFYKLCGKRNTTLVEKIVLSASILISVVLGSDSSRVKAFMQVSVYRAESRVIGGLTGFVWDLLMKRFDPLGKAWENYFKKGHPFSLIANKKGPQ